jgi:hypothetical protein
VLSFLMTRSDCFLTLNNAFNFAPHSANELIGMNCIDSFKSAKLCSDNPRDQLLVSTHRLSYKCRVRERESEEIFMSNCAEAAFHEITHFCSLSLNMKGDMLLPEKQLLPRTHFICAAE